MAGRYLQPAPRAASRSLESVWGRRPLARGAGGSIPIVPTLERLFGAPVVLMGFGAPVVLMGFGAPGSNSHAPIEWLSLGGFHRAIRTSVTLMGEVAALQ